MAPFETLSLFLLSESLRFNGWILHKDKRQKQILKCTFVLQQENQCLGIVLLGFPLTTPLKMPSVLHPYSPSFLPPPHSLSHMGNVSSHLLESTDNEQDPGLTRQHITLFSAEISAQTLIIPQTIAGKIS